MLGEAISVWKKAIRNTYTRTSAVIFICDLVACVNKLNDFELHQKYKMLQIFQ